MNECSCIVEFDEMDKKQVNKLWEYLLEKNIKFHVLKSNDDYLKEQTLAKENQELKKQLDYFEHHIKLLEQQTSFLKGQLEQANSMLDTNLELLDKYKEVIDKINKFCTSNEWAKYYEISSCRNHILDILKEVE